jgi:hypothetical protein
VVRYEVRGLPSGEATTFAYDVPTHPPTGATADLEGWAAQQTTDDAGYQHGRATLAALRLFPPDVTATVGDRVHLDATGTMSDGQPATAAVLAAVAWTSSDPTTVEVASGPLTARAHGTATIIAEAGPLRADIRVLVLAPNLLAAPTTASSSPAIPFTTNPASTAPPVTAPGTPPTPPPPTPTTGPSSTGPSSTGPPATSPPTTSPPTTRPTPTTTTTTIRTTTTTTPLVVTLDDADQTGVDRFTYAPPGSWTATTGATGRYRGTGHFDPAGTGDYFVLNFSGVQATWMGAKASGQGIALVSVDGGTDQPCDTYGPGRVDQLAIFTTPVLAQGPHTVKVTISGTKNASSTGIGLQVDFALIQTTGSTTRQAGCGV